MTHQGNDDEHGGGDSTHNVGPHTRAIHETLKPAQILLEQGAVVVVQHNLEVTLQSSMRKQLSIVFSAVQRIVNS